MARCRLRHDEHRHAARRAAREPCRPLLGRRREQVQSRGIRLACPPRRLARHTLAAPVRTDDRAGRRGAPVTLLMAVPSYVTPSAAWYPTCTKHDARHADSAGRRGAGRAGRRMGIAASLVRTLSAWNRLSQVATSTANARCTSASAYRACRTRHRIESSNNHHRIGRLCTHIKRIRQRESPRRCSGHRRRFRRRRRHSDSDGHACQDGRAHPHFQCGTSVRQDV